MTEFLYSQLGNDYALTHEAAAQAITVAPDWSYAKNTDKSKAHADIASNSYPNRITGFPEFKFMRQYDDDRPETCVFTEAVVVDQIPSGYVETWAYIDAIGVMEDGYEWNLYPLDNMRIDWPQHFRPNDIRYAKAIIKLSERQGLYGELSEAVATHEFDSPELVVAVQKSLAYRLKYQSDELRKLLERGVIQTYVDNYIELSLHMLRDPRDREILRSRLELDDTPFKTLKTLGRELGLTSNGVSQRQEKALGEIARRRNGFTMSVGNRDYTIRSVSGMLGLEHVHPRFHNSSYSR